MTFSRGLCYGSGNGSPPQRSCRPHREAPPRFVYIEVIAITGVGGGLEAAPLGGAPFSTQRRIMAKIVTLCGSTRFYEAFVEANRQETLAGRIVLSVGCFGHRPDVAGSLTPEQKEAVDALHLEKIEMSDEILVLNVNGYVGASTEREICYAFSRDKKIRWWEPYRVPPRFQKLLQKK